ncbi:MAG TPA: hypothetical protein DCW60_01185 [Sutterella sp.]|nr:hypothetical protein [Sutterella sp.]
MAAFMQFFQDNIMLFGIVFLCLFLILFPNAGRKNRGALIDNEELIEFINKKSAQVIDVRQPQEFEKGSIAKSINIPFAKFSEQMDKISKDKPVVLVDTVTANSNRAANLLKKAGYKSVYVLDKGTRGWLEAKLPFKR